MNGLRAAGWAATGAAATGALAVAMLAGGHGSGGARAVGGATVIQARQHLVVTSLRTGGIEAMAGLRVGDTILDANDLPVATSGGLAQAERHLPVRLRVVRGGVVTPVTLLQDPAGGSR